MIQAKITEESLNKLERMVKYTKWYATEGAVEALNAEMDGIREQATFNLYPLKGVSVGRLELSIESGWRMKTPSPNINYPMTATLYNISPHAGFHEVGTGAYALPNYFGGNYYRGTSSQYITPKNGRVLRFMYMGPPLKEKSPDPQGKAGSGEFIFARYVEGQPPKKYLGNAVLAQQARLSKNIGTYIMNRISAGVGSVA
jgi:hypothetical protein